MSKPSFSNIDLWLFEYAEGNLNADQEAQLELFILQHPELDVERDMWEMAKVNKVEATYPETENLYRRKPVGAYVGMGAVALLLLMFTGYSIMQWSGIDAEKAPGNQGVLVRYTAENSFAENKLQKEISDLKLLVASLVHSYS